MLYIGKYVPVPTFLRHIKSIKFKLTIFFLLNGINRLNIWCVYILFSIKYG